MADQINRESGNGRSQKRRQCDTQTEGCIVARAHTAITECADEMLGRYGIKDVKRTDQRCRYKKCGQCWPQIWQHKAACERERSHEHRNTWSESIGNAARVKRKKKREKRIQRVEDADCERRSAELYRIQ